MQQHEVVDMAALLTHAYELGDMIKDSAEVANYLYWKVRVESHQEAQQMIKEFARKKEAFSETERFGHFHPDYHKAKAEMEETELRLNAIEAVRSFKEAEDQLDQMLYELSSSIAHAVSDTIKVPSNALKPSGGGCGNGCSGGCASCG
ncbi:Cell fate regulator YlbF, YheA/YmcA/DUF963 family (controls sporulation, competence, biofilm development) [Paenibacillus aquistagni]|uniref:Cell fate regulator YlbF, YheA/YmcA/DUF963 family (Controls sporulation, competence, biofilm development) n=1 Tax=Paenibacillus aquistagni TaxID=1852522 RepID=A0A1X7IJ93_9BACL|nr:Cell fate regulator YlbF, YheA/YmcA/DUF963 family (controls sporulation, competence, biofilm development) [Paenibacillus aquistagni]